MKEAVFGRVFFFLAFLPKMVYHRVRFCTVLCICMYKHIYTNKHPSVSFGKGSRASPPPSPPPFPPPTAQQHPTEATRRSQNRQTDACPLPGSASYFFFYKPLLFLQLCSVGSEDTTPTCPHPPPCAEVRPPPPSPPPPPPPPSPGLPCVWKRRGKRCGALKQKSDTNPEKSLKNTCVRVRFWLFCGERSEISPRRIIAPLSLEVEEVATNFYHLKTLKISATNRV